jgi:hypothetical protein
MPKINWIKGAIKHPGAFSAQAKKAGMGTMDYAEEKKEAPGTTGKRARLAITLAHLRNH